MNVSVKDKDGKPVEGLTANDFALTEDGKGQQIKVFEYQRLEEAVVDIAGALPPDQRRAVFRALATPPPRFMRQGPGPGMGPRPLPPPATLVDAVLRYHDQEVEHGSGATLLRLSAERIRQREVKAALGEHAGRAARVSILWNERESEIIRVLEAA